MSDSNYNENDIQVLEGLEAVRKRPGMYIGTTDVKGLHHLVWEIVDNSIDEALAGYCKNIEIIINKDNSITVKDDGRGIPVGKHPKTGISTVETVYTVLHAGGKFGGGGYKVSGGLHGVGASVVNALSSRVTVTVYKDGKIYECKFANGGKTVQPLTVIGTCAANRTGTTVTFKPDSEIFDTEIYDYETLKVRVRELAFLNRGLQLTLRDDRDEEDTQGEKFLYEGGISEYVRFLNQNKTPIHDDIIHLEGEQDGILFEVAMQYNNSYNDNIYSFVNNINTHDGGTHEEGVRRALTRVINNYARKTKMLKEKDDGLTQDDVKEGLTMIISCKHPNPQFEGQTKGRLGNSEVRKIADNVFAEGFERFLMEHPTDAKIIVEKAMLASRARSAAKKAREATRKSDLTITNFFGKLTDCKSKDPTVCELFIVEGDSAGGSAKKGRDSMTQAILPLRGKVLNCEKASTNDINGNEEINQIIQTIGAGIGSDFNPKDSNYGKVIIMTDADDDGAHIQILLITFFYRFMKGLIENGMLYIANPPLYSIEYNKTKEYIQTDEELAIKRKEIKGAYKINRFKGLGEMDAEELFETTMDPKHRSLIKVNIEDAMLAEKRVSVLMGDKVEPRKDWINENVDFTLEDDFRR